MVGSGVDHQTLRLSGLLMALPDSLVRLHLMSDSARSNKRACVSRRFAVVEFVAVMILGALIVLPQQASSHHMVES